MRGNEKPKVPIKTETAATGSLSTNFITPLLNILLCCPALLLLSVFLERNLRP